jgi:Heparinase II/III-like protein
LPGATFTLFVGSHTGYCRLPDPVMHRRFIFHIHGAFWMVRDLLEGRGKHRCESSWHFASGLELREAEGSFIAEMEHRGTDNADPRLALVPVRDPLWMARLISGEHSPAYGIKDAAPVVSIGGLVPLPAECATVIEPLLHSRDRAGTLHRIRDNADTAVRGYRYDGPGGSQRMIFSTAHGSWELDGWTSDASFIYCRVFDGDVAHFILCDASFADLSGKSLFAHDQKIERFEWRNLDGEVQMFASNDAALRSSSHDPFRSRDFAL